MAPFKIVPMMGFRIKGNPIAATNTSLNSVELKRHLFYYVGTYDSNEFSRILKYVLFYFIPDGNLISEAA